METRSRKRIAAATEQVQSPTREKKRKSSASVSRSSISASAPAAPITPIQTRSVTRRCLSTEKKNLTDSNIASSTPSEPSITGSTTASSSKCRSKTTSAGKLPVKDLGLESHSRSCQHHHISLNANGADQGKEKESNKGKAKEEDSYEENAILHHIHPIKNHNEDMNYRGKTNLHFKEHRFDSLYGCFPQILSRLKSGEEPLQLDGLTQLCEVLSMATEDSLSLFPMRSFVTELVSLLNCEDNPEMMLLSARALTHLCDVLPISCNILVNQGAISCLCRILLSQYIDLAEQSLQALSKISYEHPAPCLKAGALTAVLSNFEFYSTGVQRAAVSTAANMCRHIPQDGSEFVAGAIPILTNLLQYPDTKVVEHASVCLTRIAESFASSPEKLDMLCSGGLIPEVTRLISIDNTGVSQASISNSTYTGLVKMLSICAAGSPGAAKTLLEINISGTLKNIISGSGKSVQPLAMNMSTEQLCEIVNLVNDLLPPILEPLVPQNISVRLHDNNLASSKDFLSMEPDLLIQFGMDLFPVLVQLYEVCINPTVRHTCLSAIHKLVYFVTADVLHSIFQEVNISGFLAGLLATKDPYVQIIALRIAELLMQKLQDQFSRMFVKEGVLQTIICQFNLDIEKSSSQISDTQNLERPKRRFTRGSSIVSKEGDHDTASTTVTAVTVNAPEETQNDLQSLAVAMAKQFRDTHFPGDSINEMTQSLKKLKKLALKLKGDTRKSGKNSKLYLDHDQTMTSVLAEILSELGRGENVSTYEFVSCGIVESLLAYFAIDNHTNERLPIQKQKQKTLRRLYQFFKVARIHNSETMTPFMTMLVRHLQSALAYLESFPVNLTRMTSDTSKGSRGIGLSILTQPLKLRFLKVSTERGLKDYPSSVVLMGPLTTLSSIEEFLWPDVRVSDDAMDAWCPSLTMLGASSSDDAQERNWKISHQKGPETRSAAARRIAAESSMIGKQYDDLHEIEQAEDDFSSADDVAGYSTDEDDEYWDGDLDDHDRIELAFEEENSLGDNVYEVRLSENLKEANPGSSSGSNSEYPSSSNRLLFSAGGKRLDKNLTVLEAIQNQNGKCCDTLVKSGQGIRWLLDEIHVLNYQRADSTIFKSPSSCQRKSRKKTTVDCGLDSVLQHSTILDNVIQRRLPCDMDKSCPTYNILLLLYVLDGLNHLAPRLHAQGELDAYAEGKVTCESRTRLLIPQEEFLSAKLITKVVRQMQDAAALCSGRVPSWCHQLIQSCPFLFPFETKRQYFYLTALGLPRAVHHLHQQQITGNTSSTDRWPQVGRLKRRKVKISRDLIFDSATKVMDLFASDGGVLEVEYFDEVGIGIGPTLEFYTLVSHELQKDSLGMWRWPSNFEKMENDVNMLGTERNKASYRPYGLFPRPCKPNSENYSRVLNCFRLLGQVVGKSLQDGRLLDLSLSTAFYKLVLDQDLDLYDIKSFDLELGSTLEEMHNLVYKKSLKLSSRKQSLLFRDTKIEDLCLDFTVPGYPDYCLKAGGENIMVNMENLEEYISLIVDATVRTGISSQMDAFRSGFNQVFPLSSLKIFNEEELSHMLCGHHEMWLPETLVEHIRFDHGYNASSPPIIYLLEIMKEFNIDEQRAFLQFVTGAPQLPCGGLSALHPKLTIVQKHPSGASPGTSPTKQANLADGELPSVMTCANYLKLPPYSCKEVMRQRLMYAIREGQGSFDLS